MVLFQLLNIMDLVQNKRLEKNQPYVIGKKTFDSEADFVKAAQSHLISSDQLNIEGLDLAKMGLDIIDPEYARELGIDFDSRKKSDDYMKTLSALDRHFQTDNMNTLSNRMHGNRN